MGATTLEQFGEVFAAAYRTRDAEAVADMYDDDAIFAMSDFGYAPAIGRAAIFARTSEIFAVTSDIESIPDEPVMVVEAGLRNRPPNEHNALDTGGRYSAREQGTCHLCSIAGQQLASCHRSRILALSGAPHLPLGSLAVTRRSGRLSRVALARRGQPRHRVLGRRS